MSQAASIDPESKSALVRIDDLTTRLARRLSSAGVMIILLLALITIADVIAREVVGRSVAGLNEIVDASMAVAIAACLAIGVAARGQLRIEFLQNWLPESGRASLDVLASGALFAFFAVLFWQIYVLGMADLNRGTTTSILRIPQAPVRFAVAALMLVCAAFQATKLAMDIAAALTKPYLSLRAIVVAAVVAIGAAAAVWFTVQNVTASSGAGMMALTAIALLVIAVVASIPIGVSLALSGAVGVALMLGTHSAGAIFGDESYAYLTNSGLLVLPFFLIMGALAGISGIASDIYRLAFELLKPVRGGLAHASIIGCAGFGALTGSSLATVATFGKIALPEMEKRAYSSAFAAGTIAAGGTLGALIPPSVPLIVYGILVEQSIGSLLLASFIPAFIGIGLYLATIAITVRLRTNAAPNVEAIDWRAVRVAARGSWAALVLFSIVWGGLYMGLFTDSEAASVGVAGTFAFAAIRGKLRLASFSALMADVSRTLSMIFPLIFGAVTFSFFIALIQVPELFADALLGANLSPLAVVCLLVASYVVMGTVMDSFAVMFITAPVYAFIIAQLGYDPIWWGIVTVVCVEIGVISPPFGMNLFVLKASASNLSMATIYRGVWPFCLADLAKVALLIAVPWLVVY